MVFQSGFSVCLIALLFLSFLIQPFHQAYAADLETIDGAETDRSDTAAEPVADADVSAASVATADETDPAPERSDEPSASEEPEDTPESAETPPETTSSSSAGEAAHADDVSPAPETASGTEPTTSTASPGADSPPESAKLPAATSTESTATSASEMEVDPSTGTATATASQEEDRSASGSSDTAEVGTEEGDDETVPTAGGGAEASTTASTSAGTTTDRQSPSASGSGSTTESEPSDSDAGDLETAQSDSGASGESRNETAQTDGSVDEAPSESEEVLASTTVRSSSSSASSSEATVDEPNPSQPVERIVTEENFFQFSKQSCVAVGNGTYHCSVNERTAIDDRAVVFSEVGSNGSQEIFIETADERVQQITDSPYDDTAPYYDAETLQIVWQRLIDGRHQVILYDLQSEEETQLTFGRTNSMEPAVSDAGVVWQMWDGSDWEIMYYNGTYTEALTDNETQEVSPVLQDGYVIWTVIGSRSQTAQVYSIATGETATIVNHEGGEIVNPRFVLIYDTQFENGDVITKRFDPETGFSEPIASRPAPEPIDIPESDSTGEIRALIQNKSSSKEDVASEDEPTSSGSGADDPTVATSTATSSGATASSTSATLDLTQASSSAPVEVEELEEVATQEATSTPSAADTPLELDEYDLVIGADGSASTTPGSDGAAATTSDESATEAVADEE